MLVRFIHGNQAALVAAVSPDCGHRSCHETLLTEIGLVLAAICHAWREMRVQRRGIDRLSFGLASNRVIPQPLGVVGAGVPWNYPISLSFVPLAAIFAAGNRAIVKLSEKSRRMACLLIGRLPTCFSPEKLKVFGETGGGA